MAKTNTVQAELTLLDKLTAPLKAAAAQVSASTKQMNTAFTSVSNTFNKVNQAMLAITAAPFAASGNTILKDGSAPIYRSRSLCFLHPIW